MNGVFCYLASDGIGSADVALNASGSATASQLFAPYGGSRYSSGSMPTDYGFTGQHSDSTSGLDYYVSRYYDPVAGQFTSPDTILPGGGYDVFGLSRYAYVEGNPETQTDPSGHDPCRFEGTPCSGPTHQPVGPGYSSAGNWGSNRAPLIPEEGPSNHGSPLLNCMAANLIAPGNIACNPQKNLNLNPECFVGPEVVCAGFNPNDPMQNLFWSLIGDPEALLGDRGAQEAATLLSEEDPRIASNPEVGPS